MQGKSNTQVKRKKITAKPYRYKFISKLIAAFIIFLAIKYLTSANFSFSKPIKNTIENGLTYNADIKIFTNALKNFNSIVKSPLKTNIGE